MPDIFAVTNAVAALPTETQRRELQHTLAALRDIRSELDYRGHYHNVHRLIDDMKGVIDYAAVEMARDIGITFP